MDPNVTLRLALKAMEDKEAGVAAQYLLDLSIWINEGGFFPNIESIILDYVRWNT